MNQKSSSRDMKFLIVLEILILLCVLMHCFPTDKEMTLGHPKEKRKREKTDNYDPKCDLQLNDNDIRETIKKVRHSGPEVKIETVSLDCFSSEADNSINLLEEFPKIAKESEMNLSDETPKEKLTHLMEGLATTASPPVTEKYKGNPWLIYPGTKWCGDGDIASSYDDLGTEEETDKCCRIHDACEDYIIGGGTKFNLTNTSSYSSLSCDCDEKLYECLRRANTSSSNSIGALYFNIFARKCFVLDHPKICKKHVTPLKLCAEYEVDMIAEKIYQWIKPKKYTKL